MTLTDLNTGFRDDEQRRRVQRVIHDRLADDRDPQECRFLMRFWWQLVMSYQEVSMDELSRNVGKPKLDVIEALISAIRSSCRGRRLDRRYTARLPGDPGSRLQGCPGHR
ncbi:hypothetical protein [Streptomyces sp. HM190]|uniref:hypothetical protein n=1 Tax=Streptomyces sp. HM190 TaxID=2695266 RepID=UPI001357858D|nr:hypothetical protein [Streptomyces sp. HM190]